MRLAAGIDADAELLVRGEAPPGADPQLVELAAFARELRVAYARPPGAAAGERQLAAIFAETAAVSAGNAVAAGRARAGATKWSPPARRGRRLAFRLAAAGLAALLAATGLAVAGVKPPKAIDDVLQRVGIGGSAKTAMPAGTPGRHAPEGSGSGEAGRDGAARARDGDRARPSVEGASPGEPGTRARGDERRSETGTTNSDPGRATADQARTGRTPPRSPGRGAEHAPEGTGPPASPGSQAGEAPAGNAQPDRRRDTGQSIAEQVRERGVQPLP